jgi:polyphenol oxidase
MEIYTDPRLLIYFGDAQEGLPRALLTNPCSEQELLGCAPWARAKKLLGLTELVVLKQTHSTRGELVCPTTIDMLIADKPEGDFLITDQKRIGLGIYAADCLPIIFHDISTNSIGICHAGWLGSLEHIAIKTVECMVKHFKSDPTTIRIFFGSCAKGCCYEVKPDFMSREGLSHVQDQVFRQTDGKLYFDLPLFNYLQLEPLGLMHDSITFAYNSCTICTTSLCSYRRQGLSARRQLTIVTLK